MRSKRPFVANPALLIRRSQCGTRVNTASAAPPADRSCNTVTTATPYCARIESATAASFSSERATSAKSHPPAASSPANSAPKPPEAPVTSASLRGEGIAGRQAAAKHHRGSADLSGVVSQLSDCDFRRPLRHHRGQRVHWSAHRIQYEVGCRRNAAAKRNFFGIHEGDDVGEPDREIGNEVVPCRQSVFIARLRRFTNFFRA